MKKLLLGGILVLSACEQPGPDVHDQFMINLSKLCGQAFEGKIISDDAADDDWRKERMVMHVRDCSDTEIKIPLHVGENRSRTWIISETKNGLRLKHDHRHEDGHPDAVTMYGGDTDAKGLPFTQSFPVDQFSKDMFMREGLSVSVTNVWTISIVADQSFTYQLSRENRDFRAEFDLTKPVDTPPPAWGFN